MKRLSFFVAWASACVWAGGCTGSSETAGRPLVIAAASSLTAAMEDVADAWEERTGTPVEVVVGASSTLARQLENGAPYGVFVTAHPAWMEAVVEGGIIDRAQVRVLAHNALVVVAPAGHNATTMDRSVPWGEGLFAEGRWALGDPDHVPAGVYAQQAIASLGVWESLEERVVPASSVRSALRLVERNEVDFGMVYRTDWVAGSGVALVAEVPPGAHAIPEISAGPVSSAGAGAADLSAWLAGPEVRAILREQGFGVGGE